MELFELPSNFEDLSLIQPHFVAALMISAPILFFGNGRFTGIIPRKAQEWQVAAERIFAVIAVLFSVFAIPSDTLLTGIIGLFAAIVILIGSAQPYMRSLAWLSLTVYLINVFLFPEIS